jgi:predicted dehydrogenase
MSAEDRIGRFGGIKYDGTPTCYVVGAGSRGSGYVGIAIEDPDSLRVTGVAEPQPGRREHFAKEHGLNDARYVTEDWKQLLTAPKNADFVLVATLDQDHSEPAIAFMEKGYHVLVEKPMATTIEECVAMVKAAEENKVMLGVCHVLRYTPYTQKIKQLIEAGEIGDVRTVNLVEPVGNWHFAHSYVRGNWRNTDIAAPVLMAKSCHDIDWLLYVTGSRPIDVFCRGQQLEFTKARKPVAAGSATRCVDCNYAEACPYDAKKVYIERAKETGMNTDTPQRPRFPNGALVNGAALLQDIEDAVDTGPYGRCVYECDNNQPDVVSAIFTLSRNADRDVDLECARLLKESERLRALPHSDETQIAKVDVSNAIARLPGDMRPPEIQVTFEMRALTEDVCKREVTVCGTNGEIRGDMTEITLAQFKGNSKALQKTTFTPKALEREETLVSGHWGADWFLMNAWCAAVAKNDPSLILSGPNETLESHLTVFAAETARQEKRLVDIQQFIEEALS